MTDIEIAQNAHLRPITEIAAGLGISEDELELYGKYKAKISCDFLQKAQSRPDGKLILVTAIHPTPQGEGKTTITVGLGQAMNRIGKKAIVAVREPSLGPVMGVKGGAAGGGYAQVVPMEEINLHFTGDMHAVTAANNLLAAMLDNHLQQGNRLDIDPRRIIWPRCLDMNDRALRHVLVGLGGPVNGVPREEQFVITVATEVMAILCLADGLEDLKRRLSSVLVAYNRKGEAITCGDLEAQGAMALLLKDAIKPNLVQTLENTPVLMHGGPFANIAHGCNSVTATRLGLKLADYCITEAGFGADLGAEKFFDIKCRSAGLRPDAAVIVATVRALRHHGEGNLEAGLANLEKHLENMEKFGVPVLVAINRFADDEEADLEAVRQRCRRRNVEAVPATLFEEGGQGGEALAGALVSLLEQNETHYRPLYPLNVSLKEKIACISREVYGAAGVEYSPAAEKALAAAEEMGYGEFPVCIAKTQYSFSDDPTLLGRPSGFMLHVSSVRVSAGAGFVVVLTGDIMTMPGLPGHPAAEKLDVYEDGRIVGLF